MKYDLESQRLIKFLGRLGGRIGCHMLGTPRVTEKGD